MAERWNLNKMDKTIYFRKPPGIQKGQTSLHERRLFFWGVSPYVLYLFLMLPYWQANANLALGIGNLRAAASGIKSVEGGFVDQRSQPRSIEGELLFL